MFVAMGENKYKFFYVQLSSVEKLIVLKVTKRFQKLITS